MLNEPGDTQPERPEPAPGPLPASHAQQRLWALAQLDPASVAYHVAAAVDVHGSLDRSALEAAFAQLVARHDALRARFAFRDGQLIQWLDPASKWPFRSIDAPELLDPDGGLQSVLPVLSEEARRPFDLEKGPLGRVLWLRLGASRSIVLVSVHHIVTDGASMQTLLADWARLCERQRTSAAQRSDAVAPDGAFAEHVVWQRAWLESDAARADSDYWRERLAGLPERFALGLERPAAVRTRRAARHRIELEPELVRAASALARRARVTPFMLLLSVYSVLLYRYSGCSDLWVATPVAGRTRAELERVVGLFVNTLVLRVECRGALRFGDLLEQVKQRALEAYAHQELPFDRVLEAAGKARDAEPEALCPVCFSLQEEPQPFQLGEARCVPLHVDTGAAKFDLLLTALGRPDGLQLELQYDIDRYDPAAAERLLVHYRELLRQVVSDPSQRLAQLRLSEGGSSPEHTAALAPRVAAISETLLDAFAAHARSHPDRIAVSHEARSISYGELQARASRLAAALQKLGVGTETPVALCFERSIEAVVGLLGVLAAGGAYVPMEPSLPLQRRALIVADAGARLILTSDGAWSGEVPAGAALVDVRAFALDRGARAALHEPAPAQLAYLLYTSGSTGTPKGVGITHAQMSRLFRAAEQHFRFTPDDVWTVFHSYAFDFSVWELWGALAHGGRAVLVPHWTSRDPEAFHDLLQRERVTVLNQTPSAFYPLLEAIVSRPQASLALRQVIFGGEALDTERLAPWFAARPELGAELVNMYGITETTVHVTHERVTRDRSAPSPRSSRIGLPLSDLSLDVVDRDGVSLPLGVLGELYVGGAGVGRGYWRRPALTAERFVPDPSGAPGSRRYRSGDLGRVLPDGSFEYLGRNDRQVQLKGHRIELGEIATALRRHASVQAAEVSLRELEHGQPRLVAYVVPRRGRTLAEAELGTQLAALLPSYMLPSHYVWLERLPLTENGKLDRAALPLPVASGADAAPALAPQTSTERALAAIWATVLGRPNVSLQDNFFALGGDSILALGVVARARQQGLELRPRQLFEHQLLVDLAAACDAAAQSSGMQPARPTASPATLELDQAARRRARECFPELEAVYPLTGLQQGLLFHCLNEPGRPLYVQQLALQLRGPLEIETLRAAFTSVLGAHAVLRTAFLCDSPPWLQVVLPAAQVALPWSVDDHALLDAASSERRRAELLASDFEKGFDLAQPVPMRVRVIRQSPTEHRVVWTHHHLILDGWSAARVLGEVFGVYSELTRGRAPQHAASLRYSDYVEHVTRDDAPDAAAFWRERLAGLPEPERFAGVARQRGGSACSGSTRARRTFAFSPAETLALTRCARERGWSLNTLASAAWALLQSAHTGQKDLAFGVTFAGRPLDLPGVEQGVGLFINTLPLRVQLDPRRSLRDWLNGLQLDQAELLERQSASLSAIARWTGRRSSELFRYLWVFENYPIDAAALEVPGLELAGWEYRDRTHYPLTVVASVREVFSVRFDYDPAEIGAGLCERLLEGYAALVRRLIAELGGPDAGARALGDLPLWPLSAPIAPVPANAATMIAPDASLPSVLACFDAWVRRAPAQVAAVQGASAITYAELDARAEHVAAALVRAFDVGDRREQPVALLLPRSFEWLAALLGAWRAGCAVVQVDPELPAERVRRMLATSRVAVALTTRATSERCDGVCRALVAGDEPPAPASRAIPHSQPQGAQLAYLIHTSGSTGAPKAVAVSHAAFANLAAWHQRAHALGPGDRVTCLAGLGFDAVLWEVGATLASGATLILVDDETRLEPARLLEFLVEQRVTQSFVPTPLAERLLELPWPRQSSLRYLLTGGDRLHSKPGTLPVTLINAYGPTENAVVSTAGIVAPSDEEMPPIGTPIDNVKVVILDAWLQPVPDGAPGELCVAGAGLARGYYADPRATAQRFVPHPSSSEPGRRLYRTGDRARFRRDGQLEFLGRLDRQVKLSGVRVEPAEIEAVLARYPGVVAAVVTPAAAGQLVAYYVARGMEDVSEATLRAHALGALPRVMVPARFVRLPQLPLTASGKVDRSALPALAPEASEVSPRDDRERLLAELLQQLLPVSDVGAFDNFFSLGGDSILSVQLVQRARARGFALSTQDIFERPILAELARALQPLAERQATVSRAAALPAGAALSQLLSDGVEATHELTPLQEGLLYHSLEPGEQAEDALPYVEHVSLELAGDIDPIAFGRAWSELVRAHAVLRTAFLPDAAERLRAVVLRPSQLAGAAQLQRFDLSALEPEAAEREAVAQIARQRREPFDWTRAPLWRASLICTGAARWTFALTHHHVLLDGWSLGLLFRDLARAYRACARAEVFTLESPPDFRGYVDWWLSRDMELVEQFWQGELEGHGGSGLIPAALRPRIRERGPVRRLVRVLPEQTRTRVEAFARAHGLTLNTLFQAAWAHVLGAYSGTRDVLFGTTVALRPEIEGAERMVGLLINTLPVRASWSRRARVIDFLVEQQARQSVRLRNAYLPLARILRSSDAGAHGAPLFDCLYVFENYPAEAATQELSGFQVLGASSEHWTHYPLSVVVVPGPHASVRWSYRSDLLPESMLERMAARFEQLLEALCGDPLAPLSALEALPVPEQALLDRWARLGAEGTAPTPHSGPPRSLLELFEARARETPHSLALRSDGTSVEYGDLKRRVHSLAAALLARGVPRDAIVGVFSPASVDQIVALLAVLTAGAAFLVLEPDLPAARLAHMLRQSGCRWVLTSSALAAPLAALLDDGTSGPARALGKSLQRPEIVPLDALPAEPPALRRRVLCGSELAYVIYTSGSTGEPKGVGVSHASFANFITWVTRARGLGPSDRVLYKTSLGFDGALWEVFATLSAGGCSVIADASQRRDAHHLCELLRRERISVAQFVPSLLAPVLDILEPLEPLPALRWLAAGGEALPEALARRALRLLAGGCLQNVYGPTEATVDATAYCVRSGADLAADGAAGALSVPIGTPIDGVSCRVLNCDLSPTPAGAVGELYIGGRGLARGYVGRPSATAERFVPDPSGGAGERLYASGDLVLYREDGQLVYLGRRDRQVKLRGQRLELGEIEAALLRVDGVRQAAVEVQGTDAGGRRLVAFVVGEPPELERLRERLRAALPEFMLPSELVRLAALPLTRSGKLDRAALPQVEARASADYAPPEGELERALAEIWAGVLGAGRVGRHDGFFELGGDSISSIQIVSRARRNGWELGVRDVFEAQTIAGVAARLRAKNPSSATAPAPARASLLAETGPRGAVAEESAAHVPLTPIQCWFFAQRHENAHHYNQAVLLELASPLDLPRLQAGLDRRVQQHAALRLRFELGDGGLDSVRQHLVSHAGAAWPLEVHDLGASSSEEQEHQVLGESRRAQARLDVTRGPVCRALYFKNQPARCDRLLLVIHHLVVDAVSFRVLLEELAEDLQRPAATAALAQSASPSSFLDWARLLAAHARSEVLLRERHYWLEQPWRALQPALAAREPGVNPGRVGSALTLQSRFSAEQTEWLLRSLPRVHGVRIHVALLGVLAQTLGCAAKALAARRADAHVLIAVEGHGRQLPDDGGSSSAALLDLSRTVGWFTAIYPLLLPFHADIERQLESAQRVVDAVPHGGIGYGVLRYQSTFAAELAALPEPDVSFNYLGQFDSTFRAASEFRPLPSPGFAEDPNHRRRYALDVSAHVEAGQLSVHWMASDGQVAPDVLQELAADFTRRLGALADGAQRARGAETGELDAASLELVLEALDR